MDQNFFEKYHLKIESKYMVEKQTMRHYGSTSLKYNLGETFQNLSTKPYDGTKEKGNNITFTDDSRKSRSIGHCLYITRGFNAFEIKKFVVDIWKGTCNRYCQQKTNIFVSIWRLVNDDIWDKSHKNKDRIFSSESHVFVFIQELTSIFFFLFVQCLNFLPYTYSPQSSSSKYYFFENDSFDLSFSTLAWNHHKKKISLEQLVWFVYVSAHLNYLIRHFVCFCFFSMVPLFYICILFLSLSFVWLWLLNKSFVNVWLKINFNGRIVWLITSWWFFSCYSRNEN